MVSTFLFFATRSEAAFQFGDMIAATSISACPGDCISNGELFVFRNGSPGEVIQIFPHEYPAGVAVDTNFNVYTATDSSIHVLTAMGASGPDFGGPLAFPNSIAFASNGHAYVGLSSGISRLIELSSTGLLIQSFDTTSIGGSGPFSVDLARDQCTLFFTIRSTKTIGRYDVCTGSRLADFTTSVPEPHPGAIRVLPDGGVLVADGSAIYRLSASGEITQTYSDPGQNRWAALALEPSGTAFWGASEGSIYEFNLAGGPAIRGPLYTGRDVVSLAVVGEPRAAVAALQAAVSTPFLSPLLLAVLGILLATAAAVRLR